MKNTIILITFFFVSQSAFAQKLSNSFFNEADQFFKTYVKNGQVDYAGAKTSVELTKLISTIENTDLSSADAANKKAFYINSYNLLVIHTAAKQFPISSVNAFPGFFDTKKHQVAGERLTLNKLEKEKLLKATGDARLHFVLVCGAVDCPPIVNFAYRPATLDKQMEVQTNKAMNNPKFIKVSGNKVALSKIFEWYSSDFGGNQKTAVEFINKYRNSKITSANQISYYEYDWTLNGLSAGTSNAEDPIAPEAEITETAANASRYVVSAAIPKGGIELKLFNNLYSQKTGTIESLTDRSTFYTTTLSALYGVNNRFNAGLELKYRRVKNSDLPSKATEVFGSLDGESGRAGITGIGPKVRIAPFPALENFSIQSTFYFPVGEDLTSNPFIDWDGPIFNTQLFNDFSIGNSFSIFTEVDFLFEGIGQDNYNGFSTPVTAILSYFPNPKTTLYVIGGFSPTWNKDLNYFIQGGAGAKYQITSDFEIELLYTSFTNKGLISNGGKANTFNFGVRYNL